MNIKKSIVVPCYNEAKNLPTLIQRFCRIHDAQADWELVLVDNGSTDDTKEVLARELHANQSGKDGSPPIALPSDTKDRLGPGLQANRAGDDAPSGPRGPSVESARTHDD